MDNQHRKIKGYRELNQDEIDLINEIKSQGESLQGLIDTLTTMNIDSREQTLQVLESKKWVAIGEAHLQQGLMALVRAVSKPDFF